MKRSVIKRGASIQLAPEILHEMEQAINRCPFAGVPLGATLSSFFVISLMNGNGRFHFGGILRTLFMFAGEMIKALIENRHRRFPTGTSDYADRLVFTWTDDKPHINGLIEPILKHFSPNQYVFLLCHESLRAKLSNRQIGFSINELPRIHILRWIISYLRCLPYWYNDVFEVLHRYHVPKRILPFILHRLMAQSRGVLAYQIWIARLRPSAVITEYDRNHFTSGLILAANQALVPTFTLQHGLISGKYGYFPILANKMFTWGKFSRDALQTMGLSAKRIELAGNPAIHRKGDDNRSEVLKRHHLPEDRPIILLATNPIQPRYRYQIVHLFCKSFEMDDPLLSLVRLHPSEQLSFYAAQRNRYDYVVFLENKSMASEEALSIADIVIGFNTGFCIEAMVKRIPVIFLDLSSIVEMSWQSLWYYKNMPHAANSCQLRYETQRILKDPEYQKIILDSSSRFIKQMYYDMGDAAAFRIAGSIKRDTLYG